MHPHIIQITHPLPFPRFQIASRTRHIGGTSVIRSSMRSSWAFRLISSTKPASGYIVRRGPPEIDVLTHEHGRFVVCVQEHALPKFVDLMWSEYNAYVTDRERRFALGNKKKRYNDRRVVMRFHEAKTLAEREKMHYRFVLLPFVDDVQRLGRCGRSFLFTFSSVFRAFRGALAVLDPGHHSPM